MSESNHDYYDRAYLSRRNGELAVESPFRRARRDSPPRMTDDVHYRSPYISSPSPKQSTRPRRNFGQTRTLRGAFAAASRIPGAMTGDDDLPQDIHAAPTPSPRRRREREMLGFSSPGSAISEPPNELVETYRRINDAVSLADLVEQESSQLAFDEPDDYDYGRGRAASTFVSSKHLPTTTDFLPQSQYPDEPYDDAHRRRRSDHTKDEQRLKRATTSRSPVFSRAKVGIKAALSADHLQRRDNGAVQDMTEDHQEPEPSLNLPTTWGSRARNRDWLESINRREEARSTEQLPADASISKFGFEIDPNSRSWTAHERSPGRKDSSQRAASTRQEIGSKDDTGPEQKSPKSRRVQQAKPDNLTGSYLGSSSSKHSPSQRNSHDLLRKLARTESPDQLKTPKAQEAPARRIYDKTPVVTGAWVDTPMTERAANLPEELTKDIVRPAESEEPREEVSEPEKDTTPKATRRSPQAQLAVSQPDDSQSKPTAPKRSPTAKRPRSREVIKPELPKSALEAVIKDAKMDRDSLPAGDDTLESLQFMLQDPVPDMKTEAEEDAAYEQAVLAKLESAVSAGRDSVDLSRLGDTLQSLAHNMNEVKQGLNSLGEQVSRETDALSAHGNHKSKASSGHLHCDGDCKICAQRYTFIRLPRLWRRDFVSNRIRPTILGWCTITFVLWFFSESAMCDQYCHPQVASHCDGNCLQPDAPRFPWVLPTMLWRWSHLSTILTPLLTVLVAMTRLVAQLLGFWDGYVDETPRALNLSGEIRVHGDRLSHIPVVATSTHSAVVSPVAAGHWQQQQPKERSSQGSADYDFASMDDDEYI